MSVIMPTTWRSLTAALEIKIVTALFIADFMFYFKVLIRVSLLSF